MADVVVVAGDLIPAIQAGATTYPMLRRAIAGFHQCHVMALLLQLAHEYSCNDLTPDGIREHMLMLEVGRIPS